MPQGNTSRRTWLTGLLSILGLSQIASAENVIEKLSTKVPDSCGQRVTMYEYDADPDRGVRVCTSGQRVSIHEYDAQARLISVCVKDDQG